MTQTTVKYLALGTRGSQLALKQAEIAKSKINTLFPDIEVEIKIIHTQGDKDLKSPLYEIGGKGVFIKELEVALQEGTIDIAVHSLKDITTNIPENLQLSSFFKAESIRDTIVLAKGISDFSSLPQGSIVATGSLRRKALLKKLRPDLKVQEIRGNVLTRLKTLENNVVKGILLSEAGLIRLNIPNLNIFPLDPEIFCPAPGQGVIAIETRKDNELIVEICNKISDKEQTIKSSTDLAFLEKVGFDCRAPLGVYSRIEGDQIRQKAFLSNPDMTQFKEEVHTYPISKRIEEARRFAEKYLEWNNQFYTKD